jgi:hypothetical protein
MCLIRQALIVETDNDEIVRYKSFVSFLVAVDEMSAWRSHIFLSAILEVLPLWAAQNI